MDSAVIRKILDTSTVDLLGAKAAEAIKRRSHARSGRPPKPAHAARRAVPAPAERAVAAQAVASDSAAEFAALETFEDASDPIDGPVDESEEEVATDIEALHEVEDNIGIATWLDPETGEPAEGMCPPHLDAE
jgi:hypothetical protein